VDDRKSAQPLDFSALDDESMKRRLRFDRNRPLSGQHAGYDDSGAIAVLG
jgi:hypothetical protein